MENLNTLPRSENLTDPKIFSDKELYEKCQEYGRNARLWLRQFAALLFEVERRQLYKKYKFYDIYNFAARLAHMSHETTTEVLRVAEKIEDKPALKSLLPTEGWSKVKVVATIATQETDQFWAKKVRDLPKHALETYVREFVKSRPGAELRASQQSENQATIFDNCQKESSERFLPGEENGVPTLFEDDAIHDEPFRNEATSDELTNEFRTDTSHEEPIRLSIRLFLEPDTELRLRELQRKLSKECGGPIGFNEVLKVLLNHYESSRMKRTKKIATDKELKQLKSESCAKRYIPASVKNLLHEKYRGRCAFPNCYRLPDIFHHTRRFSIIPNHDPDFLVPLCKNHERLAHLELIGNEERDYRQNGISYTSRTKLRGNLPLMRS